MAENLHRETVDGFGAEWARFDQSKQQEELDRIFEVYFAQFPWASLPEGAVGFDVGCGSGRWARRVAPRVGRLHAVDPSPEALAVARRNVSDLPNVELHEVGVDRLPFAPGSMDFGYSLGVLHHIPDTAAGIAACARCLKPGAPLLVYLYYRFDDRPRWFRALWRASDLGRRAISRLPTRPKQVLTDGIAATVYWPLARTARVAEGLGLSVEHLPLAAYRDKSLYAMRTDALDRFGTRLERRFTREEIAAMMTAAGLRELQFTDFPKWCCVGIKA